MDYSTAKDNKIKIVKWSLMQINLFSIRPNNLAQHSSFNGLSISITDVQQRVSIHSIQLSSWIHWGNGTRNPCCTLEACTCHSSHKSLEDILTWSKIDCMWANASRLARWRTLKNRRSKGLSEDNIIPRLDSMFKPILICTSMWSNGTIWNQWPARCDWRLPENSEEFIICNYKTFTLAELLHKSEWSVPAKWSIQWATRNPFRITSVKIQHPKGHHRTSKLL